MDFDFTTETITPDTTNVLTIGGSGALEFPFGTTQERPTGVIPGSLRWSTTNAVFEYYNGSSWEDLAANIAGTPNQVLSTELNGVYTLSTPSTFIAPGSLQYTSNFGYSTEVISAAGTTQGNATLLSKTTSIVTSATALQGVRLPIPSFTGQIHTIDNSTAVQILVYPHVGATIDSGTINASVYIISLLSLTFLWTGTTWNGLHTSISAGNAGIIVSYTDGNIIVNNAGVLTFSAGTTGLSPASPTAGNVVLAGTLSVANGGTNSTTTTSAFKSLSPLTTNGDLIYYNSDNNVRLPIGANDSILSIATGLPVWVTQASMTVGAATTANRATNLAGGDAGQIPYQTGVNTTSFTPAGTAGQILVGGTAPSWSTVAASLGYTPVNRAGDTMTGPLILSGDPTLALGAATKEYVDNAATGLIWIEPVAGVSLAGNASAPPTTPALGDTYAINIGGNTGVWSVFAEGDIVEWEGPVIGWTSNFNISVFPVGARFIVSAVSRTTPVGILAGYQDYVVTITGGTGTTDPTNLVLSYVAPENNWAVFPAISAGYFYGSSFTYSGSLNRWVQFSSTLNYAAGSGLSLTGSTFANTGVLSNVAGTGISVSNATGNVTISNTGVTSLTAGSGIAISASTGSVTISTTAVPPATIQVTANYTILDTITTVFANAAAGGFTVTLPASPVTGQTHNVKKVDQTRQTVTISGNGKNIDKYSTVILDSPFVSMQMQWNSTSNIWQII